MSFMTIVLENFNTPRQIMSEISHHEHFPHHHPLGRLWHAWHDWDKYNQNVLHNQDFCPTHGPPERVYNVGTPHGEVVNTKEKFAVGIDVSQFRPDEVKINLTGNELCIEARHEERNDQHGSIQRSFARKYVLPEDVNLHAIRTTISHDGKLTIEAPKQVEGGPQPRAIHITHHPLHSHHDVPITHGDEGLKLLKG